MDLIWKLLFANESLGTLVPWVLSLCERRLGDSDTQGRPSDDEAGAGGSWAGQEEPRGLLTPGLWPPERGRMSSAPAPAARSPGGDTHPMSSPRSLRRSLQSPAPRPPPCWTVLDVSQSGPTAPPAPHHPTPTTCQTQVGPQDSRREALAGAARRELVPGEPGWVSLAASVLRPATPAGSRSVKDGAEYPLHVGSCRCCQACST